MDSQKLQKYFSDCGVMSRRAAEEEIKNGRVLVNGKVAELGRRIDAENDIVEYCGKRVLPQSKRKICIMLNKPRGYVTTLSDEKGRRTVKELTTNLGIRVFPIGRLDMDSDGLLLMTNDGALTEKLTHPKHQIPKIYHVSLSSVPSEDELNILRSPLLIDGYKIMPVKTEILSVSNDSAVLEMTLFEGRNRQIRKMCACANLKITRLSRIAIGDISLGSLPLGHWRELSPKEIEYLSK